jgi:tetratricopeptide (TPR) repeat protein
MALGQVEQAEASADAALRLVPGFPEGLFRKGVALSGRGQSAAALPFLQAALDADFSPAATLLELGMALQSLGDFSEAIHALEVALELDADQPTVYFHLSKLVATGDYSFSAEQLERMERLLQRAGNEAWLGAQASRLCFALGVHWEKNGRPMRALDYFELGNQLTHDQLAKRLEFGMDRRAKIVAGLQNYFTPQRLASWQGWGHPSTRPIFVLGVPRSGTTLVEQVLSSHPLVGDAGELAALEEVILQWADCWLRPERGLQLTRESVWNAAEQYLAKLAGSDSDSPHVIDKMPDNSLYIGFIRLLFPQARIVSCRRDPRDVGASCFGLLFKSDRLKFQTSSWELIAENFRLHRSIMRHWEQLYGNSLVEVFYENLTSEPEQEIRRLVSALQLPWAEECLRHAERQGSVRTASVAQVRQPIYRSSQQRWRRFEPRIQPLLLALGDAVPEFETALSKSRKSQT